MRRIFVFSFLVFSFLIGSQSFSLYAQDKDAVQKELEKYGIKPTSPKDQPKDQPKEKSEAPSGNGNIKNESPNLNADVKIRNENGETQDLSLPPGQSADLPPGTNGVTVKFSGPGKEKDMVGGDGSSGSGVLHGKHHVKLQQPGGRQETIMDGRFLFVVQPNRIINVSDGPVVVIINVGDKTEVHQMQKGDTIKLPKDSKEVKVEKDPLAPKQPEDVDVRVTGSDSDMKKINKYGGKVEVSPKSSDKPIGLRSDFGDDLRGGGGEAALGRELAAGEHSEHVFVHEDFHEHHG